MTVRLPQARCAVLLLSLWWTCGCGTKTPAATAGSSGAVAGAGTGGGGGAAANGGTGALRDGGPTPRADAATDAASADCVVPPGEPDTWMTLGFSVERAPADPPADGILREAAFTAESFKEFPNPGWHQLAYYGTIGTGERATLIFMADPAITTDSLLGVPVTRTGWHRVLDCAGADGEAAVTAGNILRDEDGKLIFLMVAAAAVLEGGSLAWLPELSPEATARWVGFPDEACDHRRGGLELTVAGSKQTVVVRENEHVEVSFDGEPYVVALDALRVPGAGTCASARWVLYKKSFVHIAK